MALSWERCRRWLVGAAVFTICCWSPPGLAAESADESFIHGYVAAILQREFKIAAPAVSVEGRLITIAGELNDSDRKKLQAILDEHGYAQYRLVKEEISAVEAFPGPSVFLPLLADTRWPHFSAAYEYHLGDRALTHAAAVSFGESFSLVRFHVNARSEVDIGIHAGVFALFDLGSSSFDLLNADYLVGLPVAYRYGKFSAFLRVFHQSSHLGDEYLLRHSIPKRVNLSYEALDFVASYEWPWGIRTYAGAGYIVHDEPDLKPITTQGGIEWLGLEDGRLQFITQNLAPLSRFKVRPVVAVDVKYHEEGGWAGDYSPRIGVQFSGGSTRNLQLLLQYFHGKSPNGQFYVNNVESVGVGAHLHF